MFVWHPTKNFSPSSPPPRSFCEPIVCVWVPLGLKSCLLMARILIFLWVETEVLTWSEASRNWILSKISNGHNWISGAGSTAWTCWERKAGEFLSSWRLSSGALTHTEGKHTTLFWELLCVHYSNLAVLGLNWFSEEQCHKSLSLLSSATKKNRHHVVGVSYTPFSDTGLFGNAFNSTSNAPHSTNKNFTERFKQELCTTDHKSLNLWLADWL